MVVATVVHRETLKILILNPTMMKTTHFIFYGHYVRNWQSLGFNWSKLCSSWFKNEPCRCISFATQNFVTILNQIYNLNYGITKRYRQINMNIIAIKGYRLRKSLFSPACPLTNIARIANAVRVSLWLLVTNPQWQVFRKLKTKYKSSQLFEKHYSCRRPFCSLDPNLYVLWPDRIFCYNLGGSSSSIVLSNFLLWSLGG